ncbi:uncharacterized protein LOC133187315 [Saccostrea echinata]|uniref:uncharacterized protein LOC133187315 n=1 Tax=Saccostrea echinata TaxID=191078 RepID=UPI002A83BC9C|nr:uncharacterized protein LOC133187315 [Saccostrea echinata]
MAYYKITCIVLVVIFTFSQTGKTSPLRRIRSDYISPMQNFLLMTDKYRVHNTEVKSADNSTTDQTGNPEIPVSGNITLQSLEANNTKSDDITNTQAKSSSTTAPSAGLSTTINANQSSTNLKTDQLSGVTS